MSFSRQRNGIFFNGQVSDLFSLTQDKAEGGKTQKQAAAAEGGCSKGLAKHLKGENSAFDGVHGFRPKALTAKDFHPSIENNPYIYNSVGLSN